MTWIEVGGFYLQIVGPSKEGSRFCCQTTKVEYDGCSNRKKKPIHAKPKTNPLLRRLSVQIFLAGQRDLNTNFVDQKCLSLSFVTVYHQVGEMMEPLVRDCHDLTCFGASTGTRRL